jgi:hypothetical protein
VDRLVEPGLVRHPETVAEGPGGRSTARLSRGKLRGERFLE